MYENTRKFDRIEESSKSQVKSPKIVIFFQRKNYWEFLIKFKKLSMIHFDFFLTNEKQTGNAFTGKNHNIIITGP